MKQAVMTSPGKIEFRDIPLVEPGRGQVLIRIKRIGICGSDIHVYHGKHPTTSYPVVQGHEVSGVIENLGAGVRGFKKGDKVTIIPQMTCGNCYPCRHGAYQVCENLKIMGFHTSGAASEFFTVDISKVLKLPASMSFEYGAMVEPVAVAVHSIRRGGGVKGRRVLVLGAGPIGNLTAQVAGALGARTVMVTDLSDARLQIAEACDVPLRVNTGKMDLAGSIKQHFGEDKADVIMECVGAEKTIGDAISVARNGTDIVVVGVFEAKPRVDIGAVQNNELRLIGTLMFQQADWRTAIDLIANQRIKLQPLITDQFGFYEYPKAYEHIEHNREMSMKVMISVEA